MEQATQQEPLEVLVLNYLAARDAKEKLVANHNKALFAAEEALEAAGNLLLSVCNAVGTDTLKTPAGTVMRKVRERFWTSNWPALYACVKQYDAPFLMEQRIHNGNMKEFLSEHPEAQPAGLNVDSRYVVQVRRANSK
jgi:hypothetical protein